MGKVTPKQDVSINEMYLRESAVSRSEPFSVLQKSLAASCYRHSNVALVRRGRSKLRTLQSQWSDVW